MMTETPAIRKFRIQIYGFLGPTMRPRERFGSIVIQCFISPDCRIWITRSNSQIDKNINGAVWWLLTKLESDRIVFSQ